ncbi:MAG: 30S ribosomal protein S20 [Spirochaetia bacterium]|nr:30S ribosomal protein S20 [Spirochaetia bacterium]
MPNIKSAKKRMRQNTKRREKNHSEKSRVRTLEKKVKKLASEQQWEETNKSYSLFSSFLDKASKKNIYHKNTAARKKSRLALFINKLKNIKIEKPAPTSAETAEPEVSAEAIES